MDLEVIIQLAIALILGIIIGIERGWKNRDSGTGSENSGLRNFVLCGLFGGIAALLAQHWGISILVGIFLGLAALVCTSYVLTAQKSQDYGSTTEIALLMTFTLGALAVSGLMREAIAVAVITAWILGLKQELKQSLRWLRRQELIATLQLLLIAMVVLPLLPNTALGPWNAINPQAIGWLVLLIAGISYVGYFSIRIWGNQVGLLLTGFLGGLASSTALTVAFSRMARQRPDDTVLLAVGIILANGTMAPRLLLEVAVVNVALSQQLLVSLLVLGIVPIIAAVAIVRWRARGVLQHGEYQSSTAAPIQVKNPVELGVALQYSVLLVILSVLVHWAETQFGEQGIYLLSAMSGIADVDAVSLSLANAVHDTLPQQVALTGIWLAIAMNTVVKVVLTGIIGGRKLASWCGVVLFSALFCGFLVTLL